ncbi:MAG: PilZ domain-containing protein [Phycisphaerales bacterium]|nr:PilZ domain-containing protein [Phycisphaerales bacterium]
MADTLTFDRRMVERVPLQATATMAYTGRDDAFGLTWAEIVDTSLEGLGIISPIDAPLGSFIRIYPTTNALPIREGVVVRCTPHEQGFRIGLECVQRQAA